MPPYRELIAIHDRSERYGCVRPRNMILKIDIGERLPVAVLYDKIHLIGELLQGKWNRQPKLLWRPCDTSVRP